jgi:WD40 repeat protein
MFPLFRPFLAFAPDGGTLVSCEMSAIFLYDRTTLAKRALSPIGPEPVYYAWFAPDGLTLLALGFSLRRWDVRTWQPLTEGIRLDYIPRLATQSPDGHTLAVGVSLRLDRGARPVRGQVIRHTVRLLDSVTGREKRTIEDFNRRVDALVFAPDARTLAIASGPTLQTRDTTTGDVLFRHKIGSLHFQAVAFTPDGRCLLAARNDGTVRLYETHSWCERACYDWKIGRATCLAVAPDGLRAAAGGGSGRIVVWDLDV